MLKMHDGEAAGSWTLFWDETRQTRDEAPHKLFRSIALQEFRDG
jgi:hypothetical protein